MNDSDFDNFFNEKMNEVPHFPQKKEGWQKVATTLNSKPFYSPQSAKTKWRWLPFLLLLLGWNIWQTWALSKATANSMSLVETIQRLETHIAEKKDSFYTSRTIYHTDTIYKIVYIIEKNKKYLDNGLNNASFSYLSKPVESSASKHGEPILIDKNLITNPKLTLPLANENLKNGKDIDTEKTNTNKEKSVTNSLNIDIPISPNNSSEKSELANLVADSIQKKIPPQYEEVKKDILTQKNMPQDTIAQIDTDSAEVALNNFEKNLESKKSESEKDEIIKKMPKFHLKAIQFGLDGGISNFLPLKKNIGLGAFGGINSILGLSKRLRLTSNIDFRIQNFKLTERPTTLEPLNLPQEPSTTSDYVLRYIEGNIKSWQIGLGAQYILVHDKSFTPYLSAGYLHRFVLPSEAEFEYLNTLTGEEKSYKAMSIKGHIDHWWQIGLGGEMKIYHNIGVKLEASYIRDFNGSSTSLNYWVLRGGVFFKLK